MADTTLGHVGVVGSGNGVVARVRAWLKDRAEYRRIVDELESLDERALADLGITPADFDAIARRAYER